MLLALIAGPASADIDAGMTAFEQGDFEAAAAELRPIADRGDPRAQYILGVMYHNGLAVPLDAGKAAELFRRAALQGYVDAQVELARIYRDGDGVEQDFAEMAKWYALAAKQGNVGAQLYIADAYAYGHGVPRDLVRAYAWYDIASRYWGELTAPAKKLIADQLTADQMTEARRLVDQLSGAAAE
jgi:TPR repeat protein